MARVLGVGPGIFIVGFLWVLSLLMCLIFTRARGPSSYGGPVSVIVAALVTVILFVIPRELAVVVVEDTVKVYDIAVIYRSCLIAVCLIFLIVGFVLYLTRHIMEPIYAKPMRKLAS